MAPRPYARTKLDGRRADFLAKLAESGDLVRFVIVDSAARRAPPGAIAVPEPNEQNSIFLVEQEDPDRAPGGNC